MYFFDYRLFNKIKRRQGHDPKYPDQQRFMRDLKRKLRLDFGICSDNRDPDKKCRVKVHFPHWGGNIVSSWVPIIRPFGGTQFGISTLPEIGDKLICMFINGDRSHPIVIGSIYNKGIAKPPFKMKEGNHIRAFTSRTGSKIVFNDADGEEKIQIYMKEGKMRAILSKSKGIALVNELGDIKIKCRKLTIEAGKEATIKFKKQLKIECKQENLTLKSKKGIEIIAGAEIKFKGSKIKLKGMTAAMNKAVAKMGDQVVGVDIHQVNVPSPSGTVPTPLPHPYVGKLNDALSQNVVLDNKAVATKGSKSKHIDPGHIPTPPGVAFTKGPPSNIGEIVLNTIPTVKVNSKEIAVLGSVVKTCSFPTDAPNCQVVAVGAAVKVPMVIPGLPKDQFTKDKGAVINTRDLVSQRDPNNPPPTPEITKAEWSGEQCVFGEEVTLEADISNQYELATVNVEVYKDGADPEKDIPLDRLTTSNRGGKIKLKYRPKVAKGYKESGLDEIKFFFIVKTFKAILYRSAMLAAKFIKLYLLEMGDFHFNFDSSLLLPGYSREYEQDQDRSEERQRWALEGVNLLQCCYRYHKQHSSESLFISGHTDRSGSYSYNFRLSQARAKSVLYALTGNREEWARGANSWHRSEDFISICKWLNNSILGIQIALNNTGHIHGRQPLPENLVKNFQASYNLLHENIEEKYKGGKYFPAKIEENDTLGEESWGAIFDLYMYVLMLDTTDLFSEESPAADLIALQDGIKFMADDKKAVGCSEFQPRFNPSQDGARAAANRRVELMFFDERAKGLISGELKCKMDESYTGSFKERCGKKCPIYSLLQPGIKSENIRCTALVPDRKLHLKLERNGKAREGLEYELRYYLKKGVLVPGSNTMKGTTEAGGLLREHPVPYHAKYIQLEVKYKEYDEETDKKANLVDSYWLDLVNRVKLEDSVQLKLNNLGYHSPIDRSHPDKNSMLLDKALYQFQKREALKKKEQSKGDGKVEAKPLIEIAPEVEKRHNFKLNKSSGNR